MKELICSRCGAHEWIEKNGCRICAYCGTPYQLTYEDMPNASGMQLDSDIDRLLQKCRKDPKNAKKYANLILDIDPGNTEALKYL